MDNLVRPIKSKKKKKLELGLKLSVHEVLGSIPSAEKEGREGERSRKDQVWLGLGCSALLTSLPHFYPAMHILLYAIQLKFI